MEKLDPNTGEWVPAGTSPTCEGDVKGLQEGKEYKFRVRAVNAHGESLPLDTDEAIVAKNPFDPPAKPDPPIPMDWGPDFADLKWKPPKDDGGSPITEYIIEVRTYPIYELLHKKFIQKPATDFGFRGKNVTQVKCFRIFHLALL